MDRHSNVAVFPRHLWMLFALYSIASFMHFTHNAEYIAFYPNMPAWLSREKVYLAWLAISGVGLVGIAFSRLGLLLLGGVFLTAYGSLGLDGLGHYALALCSAHTLAMNLTIWFEVVTGAALAVCSAMFVRQRVLVWASARSIV